MLWGGRVVFCGSIDRVSHVFVLLMSSTARILVVVVWNGWVVRGVWGVHVVGFWNFHPRESGGPRSGSGVVACVVVVS